MTITLRDFAENCELHPLWVGVLYELPLERTITPGPGYTGPPPGTWTRQQRAAWLRLVEQCADMLYQIDEPPPQLPPGPSPVRDAIEQAPPDATGPELAEIIRTAAAAQAEPEPETPAVEEPPPPVADPPSFLLEPDPVPVAEALDEPDPDPEPAPIPTAPRPRAIPTTPPAETLVTDLVDCKIPGCTNKAPRRGRYAGRCTDHRGEPLPAPKPKTPAPRREPDSPLLEQHRPLARAIARKFYAPGLNSDDLDQEAMIGLTKAIRDYKPGNGTAFETFAALCIRRQVITAVKTAKRDKHRPLNDSARLDHSTTDDPEGATLHDQVASTHPIGCDPVELLITKEEIEHLRDAIDTRLTSLERRALLMRADGTSYSQIAATIGTTEKAIDNALQRARDKLAEPLAGSPPPCPKCNMPDRVTPSTTLTGAYWCDRCTMVYQPETAGAVA